MKKILYTIATLGVTAIVLAQTTLPYDVWFQWKLNPAEEAVTSYVIEQAKVSPYTNFVPLVTISPTTNRAVIRSQTVPYAKYRIVAKNNVGSAPPSNEVGYPTTLPTATTNFQTIPKP